MKKALCIGAHPDDIEFAMGGTVALLVKKGWEVKILDITNGEPTPFGSPEIREKESQLAAEILQVERKTLPYPNRFLQDTIEIRKAIAEEIRTFQPQVLFIHYPQDAHPDHWAASQTSQAARFYAKLSHIDLKGERYYPPRIFYFFSVHLRISPPPSFCIDITSTMSIKEKALLAYKSQFHEIHKKIPPSQKSPSQQKEEIVKKFLHTFNGYWGLQIRTQYAEPFYSPEILGLQDIENLVL